MGSFRDSIRSIINSYFNRFNNDNNKYELPNSINNFIEQNYKDYEEIKGENHINGRNSTIDLLKKLNYDDLPKLVDSSEFEDVKKNSEFGTLYRGISASTIEQAAEYEEQFKKGELYVGGTNAAIRGRGIYTCYGKDARDKVAEDYSTNGGKSSNGTILEMVLKEEANIIEYDKLVDDQNNMLNIIAKGYSKYDKSIVDFDSLVQNMDKITDVNDLKKAQLIKDVLSEPGHYAAINGYDAINVTDKKYMVILNRAKVICRDKEKDRENIEVIKDDKNNIDKECYDLQSPEINKKEESEFVKGLQSKVGTPKQTKSKEHQIKSEDIERTTQPESKEQKEGNKFIYGLKQQTTNQEEIIKNDIKVIESQSIEQPTIQAPAVESQERLI